MENDNHPATHSTKEPSTMRLYVRFGDAGDYESFGSVQQLRTAMIARNIVGPFAFCNAFGLVSEQFAGNNYISVFWSSENAAMPEGSLSEEDLNFINKE